MDTYLAPIEKPESLAMKLAYFFTRKKFGKVLTPLKVHTVRLPLAFGMFYNKINQLDEKLVLPGETALLIREFVSRLNVCEFCMDIGRSVSIEKAFNLKKFDALPDYGGNPVFSPAEKAALAYAESLTLHKQVSAAAFQELRRHFSEREICEIVYLIATEHVYNLTNIGLNIHSDMLCDIRKKKVRA